MLELQLMPGLLHALDEGLAWHAEQGTGTVDSRANQRSGQSPCIDDWNWLTVAVFTCAASCGAGPGAVSISREQVELCME